MKHRQDNSLIGQGKGKPARNMVEKYWWTCYAGAQNEGKGCGFWKVMDAKAEGRGPFVYDKKSTADCNDIPLP